MVQQMEYLIRGICYCVTSHMTMYCPNCGALMVWKNGSILHEPPTKRYECGYCEIILTKYADGSYEIIKANSVNKSSTSQKRSSPIKRMLHIK
jgi:endogenous inhibitor of DNA gyrase (YacG/DUF329 family)